MNETADIRHALEKQSLFLLRVIHGIGNSSTFVLAAVAVIALTMNVVMPESFGKARLAPILIGLIILHLMRFEKFQFNREIVLYGIFFVYMLFELLWTDDIVLARNTLVPALNFLLIMVLFGSLVTYHGRRNALAGMLVGFWIGALTYTNLTGFPFRYPADFSYNAVAVMYLFGLFLTLLLGCHKFSKGIVLVISIILLAHIVATTSIKTNLGILLGGLVAAIVYFRQIIHLIRQHLVPVGALFCLLGYIALSNQVLMLSIQRGLARISLGVEILRNREGLSGQSSFGNRAAWMLDGLEGWIDNPVFGHGVESFRAEFDITSHSTPIDLLYNSGLIGLVLFYSVFLSVGLRLLRCTSVTTRNLRLLILSCLMCFLFTTLSGVMHYNLFLAAFIAISISLLNPGRVMPLDSENNSRLYQ